MPRSQPLIDCDQLKGLGPGRKKEKETSTTKAPYYDSPYDRLYACPECNAVMFGDEYDESSAPKCGICNMRFLKAEWKEVKD